MNTMQWITGIIEIVVVALICVLCSKYYVHMLQLESYQLDGYKRWMSKNRDKITGWTLTVGVLFTFAYYALWLVLRIFWGDDVAVPVARLIVLTLFVAVAISLYLKQKALPQKKPLVYTARVKRLYVALSILTLLVALLLARLGIAPLLLFVGIPYLVLIAGYAMQPIENQINNYYMRDARKRLEARPELIKIGITGSYGKTSTKFALDTILSEKYDVLATRGSFNTPMGLTRVIREQLEKHHQVFIAEMGARHVGDISELMELVHPQYGVITSVGPQHLETFGSIEAVASTKNELIKGLPEDGVGFFASDGAYVDRMYNQAHVEKYRAGLDGGYLDMRGENIEVGTYGSSFDLVDGTGERIRCETKLLGLHNIQNLVLCCVVAKRLGLTMEQIARGVSRVEPVEHRLQIIPGANGITVIDDAFNSNPAGAKAALEVLKRFPGRRLIVTPGMVELGEQEADLNYRFGQQMADSCDIIMLIGKKRARPMVQALVESNFNKDNLHVLNDIGEATALLAQIGQPGDVVLFENDLPDNYSEN